MSTYKCDTQFYLIFSTTGDETDKYEESPKRPEKETTPPCEKNSEPVGKQNTFNFLPSTKCHSISITSLSFFPGISKDDTNFSTPKTVVAPDEKLPTPETVLTPDERPCDDVVAGKKKVFLPH